MNILPDLHELTQAMTAWRRELHANPQTAFEETFASLAEDLCDPFRRLIESIRCRPLNENSETSGSLQCDIRFRCSGPCGDWVDESAIYQSQQEFTTSNSCTCSSEGGAKRAPLVEDHINAISDALNGISITNIRV